MKRLKDHLKRRLAAMKKGEEGFSLTEIMVAVFIMGLLATVVLINVLPARDSAMVQKAKTDIRSFESALEQYRLDMLDYPENRVGLQALIDEPTNAEQAGRYREGGYLTRGSLPKDPWGNDYQYRYPGENSRVDIFSLGADGRPGGEDLNADIGNWEN
ncbi:MAG: type II secretion system protein GspG [Ponticaulis sp.]|nr:type II secretion system protein GspG [Ponticaulis sp.]